MIEWLNAFRDMSMLSVTLRLGLAFVCGGIIGAERELKRHQAGFRTHILICLGAAMTTLTSQYLSFVMGYFTDIGRLGAQVVAGIGFIGAGAIIITRRNRVKGLTTAAGLWASAIIGLCFGAGFYEGGVIATVLLIVAETAFSKIEYRLLQYVPEIHLHVSYAGAQTLNALLELFKQLQIKVLHLEITRNGVGEQSDTEAILNLRLNKRCTVEQLLFMINREQGVKRVEEL